MDVYSPWATPEEIMHEYGIKITTLYPEGNGYRAIILALAHKEFLKIDLNAHNNNGTVIYYVKGILEKGVTDGRL